MLLPLVDLAVTNNSAHRAGELCAEHLNLLGARTLKGAGNACLAGALTVGGIDGGEIDCRMPWQPSGAPSSEATIQAISGLIGVHSLDRKAPVRLGLDVASAATGILATQGILAALIARRRGQAVRSVRTTALDGALIFLRHHLAIATSDGTFPFRLPESGGRPPFCTSDGQWFEIEALSGDSWKAFWATLGLDPIEAAGKAWLPYVYRYLSGRCRLPMALHEATRRHSFGEVCGIAAQLGIGLCRVRTYHELLEEPNSSLGTLLAPPWTITPSDSRTARHSPANSYGRPGPLQGMRVVEATSRLQGPLAGLLLGMLGAEVTKVEPPGGDFGKHSPPLAGTAGAAYLAYNLGKTCVEIDYKSPSGISQLRELVAGADVFIHNWRPGRAGQLGLDAESLLRLNPALVYAEASGWGSHPPPCTIAGDFLVQAYAACGDGLNSPGEPPFPSPLTLVDVTGGLVACEGILAALYLRELTGHGSKVETSLLAGAMWLQSTTLRSVAAAIQSGRSAGPLSDYDRPLPTNDGFLVIDDRDCRVSSMVEDLGPLHGRNAREWEGLLLDAGIAAGAVRTDLRSLSSDPRFAQIVQRVHEGCFLPAPPWRFN